MFHHTAPYIDAYRRTTYVIEEPIRVTRFMPERRSVALDRLLARHHARSAAYLSAMNPESRPTPRAENRRSQRRLIACVTALGCRVLRGVGVANDGAWEEEGLLVYPLAPRRAGWIGRIFRQNAFLACRVGRPVRIAPLR